MSPQTQTVRVGDATPLVVIASIEQPSYKRLGYLWSPSHGMIDLEFSASVTDDGEPEPPTWEARAFVAEAACDRFVDYVIGERSDIPLGFFEVGEPGAPVIGNRQ
jgi:hypothetical protein